MEEEERSKEGKRGWHVRRGRVGGREEVKRGGGRNPLSRVAEVREWSQG